MDRVENFARLSALLLSCSVAIASSGCKPALIIHVSNTKDDGRDSLRAALRRANVSRSSVTIRIAPGMYELTRCGEDDRNLSGDLDVTTKQPVTLTASEEGVVIRQTCAGERVLDAIGTPVLTLKGVTLTGGTLVGADPAQPAQGGGLRAYGDVVLERATLTANSVTGASGDIGGVDGAAVDAGPAHGGGLYVAGSLSAIDSTFSNNCAIGGASSLQGGAAEGGGAFVGGRIDSIGGSISDNCAIGGSGSASSPNTVARGGGLAQAASSTDPVSLSGTMVSDNQATTERSRVSRSSTTVSEVGTGDALGGGIASAGHLELVSVTASGNRVVAGPASVPCSGECMAGVGRGGAIAALGTASIRESTFRLNHATGGNGPYQCVPASLGCTGAAAAPGSGGAIWAIHDLSLSGGVFTENSVTQGQGVSGLDGAAYGGAVAALGKLAITGGEYTSNSAVGGHGGALSAGAVTIAGATFVGNTAQGRGGAVDAATLTGSAIVAEQNRAGGSGGGAIAVSGDASLSACSIRQNSVGSRQTPYLRTPAGGGALRVGRHLTLSETALIGNSGAAEVFGGAQPCAGGCPATFVGGGIFAASVEAEQVTLAANQASGQTFLPGAPEAFPAGPSGGGAIAATGRVSLRNATLHANSTSEPVGGGFEWVRPPQGAGVLAAAIALDHVTLTENSNAPTLQAAALTAHRSVAVASANQAVCAAGTFAADSSYNWFSDSSCALSGAGDRQESAAFLLGPLADNGGRVPTRLPEDASVLRDLVPIDACALLLDARGVSRPQGSGCDVGAVEISSVPNFVLR